MADPDHPARVAGLLSQQYIANKQRDAWLDLFAAEGCVVQDPVGVSPLDPTGQGQIGRDGIAAFYDDVISKGEVSFHYPRSYAAGDECAFIGAVTNEFPGGQTFRAEGVFVYKVDAEGKLLSLRAFWEFDRPSTEGLPEHPPVGREG